MSFNVNIWLQNVQPTNIIIFMVILTVLFGRYSEVLHSSILSGRYADALQTERKCIDMIFLYQEFIEAEGSCSCHDCDGWCAPDPSPSYGERRSPFQPGRNLQSTALVIGQGEVHILIDLPFSLLTAKILSFSQSSLLEVLISSTSNLTSIFLKVQ